MADKNTCPACGRVVATYERGLTRYEWSIHEDEKGSGRRCPNSGKKIPKK